VSSPLECVDGPVPRVGLRAGLVKQTARIVRTCRVLAML
jgi:hypothetical protein